MLQIVAGDLYRASTDAGHDLWVLLEIVITDDGPP